MRNNFRPFALLYLVFMLVFCLGVPTSAQNDEDALSRIDAVLSSAAERNNFSGTVLISVDGEIIFNEAYGYAVREWDVENTIESKFLIGSITKQFTGMAILMLQERDLLNVQDLICDYLRECPDSWADITIYHLLTHTSGITEVTNMRGFEEFSVHAARPENVLDLFINEPLDFQPGEAWSYSNSGYIVLGLIIEELSGQRYQNFLRENIFEPLGMENTGFGSNTQVIENFAQGYATPFSRANYLHLSIPYAAGALYSTVGDLYLWNEALFNGAVVSQESWDAMIDNAYTMPNGTQYAYGLVIDEQSEYHSVSHGGGIDGFTTFLLRYTEENANIIILENLEVDPTVYNAVFAELLFGD